MTVGEVESELRNVHAISDTDVWVVGEIIAQNPNGSGQVRNNAAHWDGRNWTMHAVYCDPVPNKNINGSYFGSITAVFGFSHDNVVFSTGRQVQRWNGKTFTSDIRSYDLFTGWVTGIWGTSDRDIWFVGAKGYNGKSMVVHYDGKDYRSFTFPFTYDVNDVWGVGDTAYCVASDYWTGSCPSAILRLTHNKVEPALSTSLHGEMQKIWYCPGMNPMVAGGGVEIWHGSRWGQLPHPPSLGYRPGLRGASPFDYFILGEPARIEHWNGRTWKRFDFSDQGIFQVTDLSCTGNDVWAIDGLNHVIHGKRRATGVVNIGGR